MESETTTIRVTPETKSQLDSIGHKGDTYEDIIKRLLDQYKRN
jgi:predicted transcriptional regulator